MNKRSTLKAVAAAAIFALAGVAQAQQTIKIANIVELSGPGTTAGTVFKNGVELAVKEINDNGGNVATTTEIYTVDTGSLTIQPNLAALSTFDGRSHAKVMVEAIEAAIQGRASSVQLRMAINNRSIEYLSPTELIKWLSFYRAEVAKEAQAETIRKTGANPRNIGVRCTRV